MFGIGFSELLLIAVAGIIFIAPKDLPMVLRQVMKFTREIRALYSGLKRQMTELIEETGIDELKANMTTIIDLEGKPQRAYDVGELEALAAKPALPPKADA